eukprot:g37181.t1
MPGWAAVLALQRLGGCLGYIDRFVAASAGHIKRLVVLAVSTVSLRLPAYQTYEMLQDRMNEALQSLDYQGLMVNAPSTLSEFQRDQKKKKKKKKKDTQNQKL